MELNHGITVLDTHFVKPGFAASFLIQEGKHTAFVDTGTSYSVPGFMDHLEKKSIVPDQVEYIILSHIHLDHAGGAGALMQACPAAKLVVHPRGSRHMIDPTKLIAGTYAVFGEENAKRLYGEIKGIPEDRVIVATDNLTLHLGNRKLLCFDAPGHARHHLAVWDEKSRGIFTGDAFGLSYRVFDTKNGAFTFPTTTPVHFDPAAMHATVGKCLSFNPEYIYLTHFGAITDVPEHAKRMHKLIDAFVEITTEFGNDIKNRYQKIYDSMALLLHNELLKHGSKLTYDECLSWLEKDLELNTQGLLFWWDHFKKPHSAVSPLRTK